MIIIIIVFAIFHKASQIFHSEFVWKVSTAEKGKLTWHISDIDCGFREIDPYNISNSQRKAGIYSRKAPNFAVGNICIWLL